MNRTSKISGAAASQQPQSKERVRLNVADPEKIEQGKLWVCSQEGKWVNANASPEEFDSVISSYIDLIDRAQWPLYQRAAILSMANAVIPFYSMDTPPDAPC